MYSFYGGKQGRTYNIVERYDQIYIDQSDRRPEKPDGKLIDFEPDTWYDFGEYLFYQGSVYLVLHQTENVQGKIDINNLKIKLDLNDLNNTEYVARIKGMVNEFQKGGAYTDANYGQYVIIDTILNQNHKNDDINGIIYRRGFDYTEVVNSYDRPHKDDKATRTFSESGEKEFPNLYVYHDYEVERNGNTWNVIDKGFNTSRWVAAWRKYILKPGGGAIYVGQIVGPQGDSPEIIGLKWSEFLNKESTAGTEDYYKNIEMEPTPGWDGFRTNPDTGIEEPVYNDYIRTGYCNIKDKDNNVTGAYLSFNIPQTIFKFSAQSVSPYGEQRSHYDEASKKTDNNIAFTATQDRDTGEWKYTNLINQHSYTGATGQNERHPFYYNFDIAIPKGIHGQDISSMQIQKGSAIKDNLPTGIEVVDDDEYIIYYITNYNNSSEGNTSKPQGIWPYRVIDKISINKKERSRFAQNSPAKIGDLYIPNESNNIVAVCIQAGTTGSQLEFNPTESELGKIINSGTSSWRVVRIPSTAAAAQLQIDYKAGESDTPSTRLLDYLTVDSAGNIYASYSDSNQLYYLTNIGGVENIFISNEKNITQAQYWAVKYQGRNSSVNVSNPLNRLLAIDRQGDNIIALYSDPGYRQDLVDNGTKNVDYYQKEWKENTSLGKLAWENLGSIGGGVHIQGEYTLADLKQGGQLENGLTGDRAGWVVTVKQGNNYYLYAYDNHNGNHDLDGENSHWYVIKDIGADLITPVHSIRVSSESSGSMYQVDQLNENGLWFVVSDGHVHN